MSGVMVAFDLVGTLVKKEIFVDARKDLRLDIIDGWDNAENQALFYSHFDYEAVFCKWLDHQRKSASKMLSNQFAYFLVEHAASGNYLYPEVSNTLASLATQGVRFGFVSDGAQQVEGAMIKRILTYCGISDEQIIVTGDMTGFLKKEKKPFQKLIELANNIGIADEQIVFVGDKPSADIDGTVGTGIKAILINRDNQKIFLGVKQPWRIIMNLMDIVNFLPEISSSQGVSYGTTG